ncbi:MAG TPA: acyl-CoA carboxylase subunit epsilon [Streptosporangiaceae bacterium]|nr:acyl-CoA carboxylase subunit epsilon [Streptosporangiaceae bacterium]
MPDQPKPPALQIIRGDATPEEVAAILAVLAVRTRRGTGRQAPANPPSVWADKSRLMREPISPSPAGWRRSAFPR